MHPAELVCIVTSAVSVFVCCIVVGKKTRNGRTRMIDFDAPPGRPFGHSRAPSCHQTSAIPGPVATSVTGSERSVPRSHITLPYDIRYSGR